MPFIVDVDDDQSRSRTARAAYHRPGQLEFHGVEQRDVYDTIRRLLGGIPVGYSHAAEDAIPIEIAVAAAEGATGVIDAADALDARAGQRTARRARRWSNSAMS